MNKEQIEEISEHVATQLEAHQFIAGNTYELVRSIVEKRLQQDAKDKATKIQAPPPLHSDRIFVSLLRENASGRRLAIKNPIVVDTGMTLIHEFAANDIRSLARFHQEQTGRAWPAQPFQLIQHYAKEIENGDFEFLK